LRVINLENPSKCSPTEGFFPVDVIATLYHIEWYHLALPLRVLIHLPLPVLLGIPWLMRVLKFDTFTWWQSRITKK
jgi:hypothetical protein